MRWKGMIEDCGGMLVRQQRIQYMKSSDVDFSRSSLLTVFSSSPVSCNVEGSIEGRQHWTEVLEILQRE